jgi:hypothetical protein
LHAQYQRRLLNGTFGRGSVKLENPTTIGSGAYDSALVMSLKVLLHLEVCDRHVGHSRRAAPSPIAQNRRYVSQCSNRRIEDELIHMPSVDALSTSTSGAKPASIVLLCQVPLASRSSSLMRPGLVGPFSTTKMRSLRNRSSAIALTGAAPHSQSFVHPTSGEPRQTWPVSVPRNRPVDAPTRGCGKPLSWSVPVFPQNGSTASQASEVFNTLAAAESAMVVRKTSPLFCNRSRWP